MSHHLSKTIQTECKSLSSRHSCQGGGPCDGGSQTYVGTTDVSPPVKNKTDSRNQLSTRHSYQGGGLCEIASRICIGTTDLSPLLKNNTDRRDWLIG